MALEPRGVGELGLQRAEQAGDALGVVNAAAFEHQRGPEPGAVHADAERLAAAATNLEALLLEPARIARDAAYAAVLEGSADVVKLVDADRAYADARLDALSLLADAVVAQRRLALMIGLE